MNQSFSNQPSSRCFVAALAAALFVCGMAAPAHAVDHQTPTLSALSSQTPFRVELKAVDVGAMTLPTLHSFSSAEYDGKLVLFGGRTNGLHGFESSGGLNFPVASQNRDVWVIDIANRQSWRRSLNDPASGLDASAIAALTIANTEFLQKGNNLYVVGGYGELAGGGTGTLNTLTAVSLPGMVNWAMGGAGTAAPFVRQTSNPALQVTGGGLVELNGRMQLVFGQNFQGGYVPGKTGTYTQQVRSFDLVDDGVTVSATNFAATTPNADYRRRDLNVIPVMRPDGAGGSIGGATALAGVFTPTDGVWTVPVELDGNGTPTMADPLAAGTFKQGFNGYESAKFGVYSEATGTMHEVLLGGISLQYVDEATGVVITDDNMPFVNDVTAISIDAEGHYAQSHLGYFPVVLDQTGNRLRFGSNAEFFAHSDLATFENGVIKLDELQGTTSLGYVYGGIASNSPHVRGVPGAVSGASNLLFEVVLVPVPEPSTTALCVAGLGFLGWLGRRRQQRGRH